MPSVLIIDDEPNIRRMVGALLEAEGFEVRDASDGQSGVARAMEWEPDLVLLDLMMPGTLDGMATLELLRERFPELPVVMMSGRAGLADAVKALQVLNPQLVQEITKGLDGNAGILEAIKGELEQLSRNVGAVEGAVGQLSSDLMSPKIDRRPGHTNLKEIYEELQKIRQALEEAKKTD